MVRFSMSSSGGRSRGPWPAAVAALAGLALGGCGPRDKYHVSGTVRFPDGEPVTEGRLFVRYGPDAIRQASALIESDGSFRVGEFKDGDGMRGGTVRVGVVGVRYIPHMSGGVTEIPLCDERYFDPETSGLVFEVPKQRRWEIVVERPAQEVLRRAAREQKAREQMDQQAPQDR